MGKAKLHSATSPSEIKAEQAVPITAHPFSNGELGQIQEILFGAQQRSTNEQLSALQSQLNEQIETLSNMLNSRINQLTESIEKTNKTLENQLSDLKAEQSSSATSLSKTMQTQKQELETSMTQLSLSSGEETKRIHVELESAKSELLAQVRDSHDSLLLQMDSSVELLQNNKLDKQSLAQLLGGVSEQLDAPDSTPSKTRSSGANAPGGTDRAISSAQSASPTVSKTKK